MNSPILHHLLRSCVLRTRTNCAINSWRISAVRSPASVWSVVHCLPSVEYSMTPAANLSRSPWTRRTCFTFLAPPRSIWTHAFSGVTFVWFACAIIDSVASLPSCIWRTLVPYLYTILELKVILPLTFLLPISSGLFTAISRIASHALSFLAVARMRTAWAVISRSLNSSVRSRPV